MCTGRIWITAVGGIFNKALWLVEGVGGLLAFSSQTACQRLRTPCSTAIPLSKLGKKIQQDLHTVNIERVSQVKDDTYVTGSNYRERGDVDSD